MIPKYFDVEAAEGSSVSNSTEARSQCGGQKAGVVSREGVYNERCWINTAIERGASQHP